MTYHHRRDYNKIGVNQEFDNINTNIYQKNNLDKYISNDKQQFINSIEKRNSSNDFGFYDIYLELDTKYRERNQLNNTDFIFKLSGRKDSSTGTNTGIIGL